MTQKQYKAFLDSAIKNIQKALDENDIKEIASNYEAMIKQDKVIKNEKNKEILDKLTQISQCKL